jgi:hypothetical protein
MERAKMSQMIPNAEKRFLIVERRAGDYRTQVESETGYDSLMHDSATAVLCFDFADLVAQGNNVYESINGLNNDWRNLVYTGAIPYSDHSENRIKKLYERWLDASKNVNTIYGKIETDFVSRGFDTKPIHDLRRAIREVEAMACDDSSFFASAKLIELRDAAIDDFRGNTDMEFVAESAQ